MQRLMLALLCTSLLLGSVRPETDDDDATVETEEEEEPEEDVPYASPEVPRDAFFAEHFDSPTAFEKRWTRSQAKKDDTDEHIAKYDGRWSIEPLHKHALQGDRGLVLKSKAKHAAICSRLTRPFHFLTKPLVVQYEVNLQNGQQCGGAYLKLISDSPDLDEAAFRDKTPYTIMFGPDKCGNDHKLHFIFRHRNPVTGEYEEKHAKRATGHIDSAFTDKHTHLYKLVVRPDNTFEISVDDKVVNSGSLLEDMTPPVNPPEEIDDPDDRRPSDWDERAKIPDPDATKPDDWDEEAAAKITDPDAVMPDGWLPDEPEMVPDPDAQMPADWDAEMDGEWEAPLISNPACASVPGCGPWSPPTIDNPAYKGKWRPPMIDNPAYRGKWAPRRIPNPGYFQDLEPFKMTSIGAVGMELWSMSDDIYFDNLLITDSLVEARQYMELTFQLKQSQRNSREAGVVQRFMKYSNDRPWLYAVYVVAIGLPLVLFIIFCCMSGNQKSEEVDRKKTDAPEEDDVELEEPPAEEEEEAALEQQEGDPEPEEPPAEKEEEAAPEQQEEEGEVKEPPAEKEEEAAPEQQEEGEVKEQRSMERSEAAGDAAAQLPEHEQKESDDQEEDSPPPAAGDGDASHSSPRRRRPRRD